MNNRTEIEKRIDILEDDIPPILFHSALDYGVNAAEYDAFLFEVAVGFVDLST